MIPAQAVSATYYKFQIGQFNCISVSDGTFDYDPAALFNNLDEEETIGYLGNYPLVDGKIRSPYTFLYVDTGKNKILTDMGAGKLGPNTGLLLDNLRRAGIDPEEIDAVFITHAHPDHIGGTLNASGRPNYPNATYYIWKDEWDFWFSEKAYQEVVEHYSAILHADIFMKAARGQLGPVQRSVVKLTGDGEVLPGVKVHFTPGHTPGHMAVSFESGGEKLYFVGDAMVFSCMIEHPEIEPIFDIIAHKADETRKELCNLLAEERALVLAQHFPPFPSLGYIESSGEAWSWKPLEAS
jgi:glyoxylase-like metal-dependent hydrolase (beta-lactamase superfamily II)